MSSSPWIHTSPGCRLVKIEGRLHTVERVAPKRYIVWLDGKPMTEVFCAPVDAQRWYWRGSGLEWSKTRQIAMRMGISRGLKGKTLRGGLLPDWSEASRAAIAKATGSQS